ncbi:MAG TPA: adenosylcobalamin-dependent ribonucleoside-diphosphate reductase [Candidatus Saccharimonadales bacterium]|nr:adenosylcobalamin-dependent ribonucleoside-diphosphate reductase [Candidatus Saccharimonadales bacterium]
MASGSSKNSKSSGKEFVFSVKTQKKLENLIEDASETTLEGVRAKVFRDRYSLKDNDGQSTEEHPEQMWKRVAAGLAQVEKTPAEQSEWAKKFYSALKDFKYVPGGRVLSGAGTPYEVTFYNCFVIPSPHDSRNGIIDNLKLMVDIMSRSGGVGINLSSLRPRGARVKKVNGTSSGPTNWAELYSTATHDVIQQGGTRRGALMLMLNDWHPDVEEFITVKEDLSRINGANLSVCVTDAFMDAVKKDADWDLYYPDLADPDYDKLWDGDIDKWKAAGKKVVVYKTVKAAEVWEKICQSAWRSAEPGLHFIERSNKRSNTWYFEKLIATNPCGEQPLGAWAVCNLGAVNLSAFVNTEGEFDFTDLEEKVEIAIRMMDNVIDATGYYFPENKEQQMGIRRTGLGTMGLGDALIKMKLRYGSPEAQPTIEKIYKTIRDAAYETSALLASERGAFPNFKKDKYLQGWFIKKLPERVKDLIAKNGIRNAVLLTQAPTGTTSLVSGVSSGIEPVYDFAMVRRDRTGESTIYHPLYQEWKEQNPAGTTAPDYFVSANDLTPEDHVSVQGLIQDYTDSSISKTVNAPNAHTVEEVRQLYMQAYDLGCKGVTYMRDGSREGVLSHKEEKKETKVEVAPPEIQLPVHLRKRPDNLHGITRRIATPVGHAFVTINEDEEGNPFEVFINVGKAGTDIYADAEAIGRLISLALRIPSNYSPTEVIQQVVNQLSGIGGSSTRGFGADRIHSLADAVSKVLSEYSGKESTYPTIIDSKLSMTPAVTNGNGNGHSLTNGNGNGLSNGNGHTAELAKEEKTSEPKEPSGGVTMQLSATSSIGKTPSRRDICPKCGVASFVHEEGCAKCMNCGHSEC